MTLTLYVLRLLSAAVVVSAGGLFFIAIPGLVVGAVHKLGGVDMAALLGYMPIVLVELVPYLLPIGFLLAIVATYGRLAADNEWTAIQMAGFHPLRILVPGLVIAGLLGALSHWLSSEVSPGLAYAKREYARQVLVDSLREANAGQTEFVFGDFYLSAHSRDPRSNRFRDVTIRLPSSAHERGRQRAAPGAGKTVLAEVAEFSIRGDFMRIELERMRVADPLHAGSVGELAVEIAIDDLVKKKPKNRDEWKFQTSAELARRIDAGEVSEHDLRKALFELHNRSTRTATYFLFLLLGVPTGLLLRRGTQLGALAVAVGYALVYYLLSMRLGKALAGWGTIPPVVAAWATTGLGAAVGVVLCWRAFRR